MASVWGTYKNLKKVINLVNSGQMPLSPLILSFVQNSRMIKKHLEILSLNSD